MKSHRLFPANVVGQQSTAILIGINITIEGLFRRTHKRTWGKFWKSENNDGIHSSASFPTRSDSGPFPQNYFDRVIVIVAGNWHTPIRAYFEFQICTTADLDQVGFEIGS